MPAWHVCRAAGPAVMAGGEQPEQHEAFSLLKPWLTASSPSAAQTAALFLAHPERLVLVILAYDPCAAHYEGPAAWQRTR